MTIASLASLSSRLGLAGTAALIAVATLCLLPVVRRLLRGKILAEASKRNVLLFLLLVHTLALCLFFPPDEFCNDRPVVTLDHSIHYYQVVRTRTVLWKYATVHSYDPFFMAGYPAGALFDIDMKGAELFCAILYPLSAARAMKLYIVLCYLTLLITLYRGSRLLGFSYPESILGVMLVMCFWHAGRPYAGAFRFAGMFGFIFVTHLSFYVTGLFRRFVRGGPMAWFFIVGPLSFLVHPTAVVIMPVAFIAILLVEIRRLTLRTALLFLLWCLIVVAVNAIWLGPLLRYLDIKTPTQVFFQLSGIGEAVGKILQTSGLPALVMVLLAGAGAIILVRSRRWHALLPTGFAALFLLLIASYGCHVICIDQMEPGRFLYSFLIFLTPLAGVGLHGAMRLLRLLPGGMPERARSAVLGLLLLSPLWLGFVESRMFYRHRLSTRLPADAMSLVARVSQRTDRPGRFMVEDGFASHYGNVHLPGMLPLLSGREQIGGPYPYTFVPHHYTTFQLNKTFGKPLVDTEPDEFYERLEQYNIRWILTASREARTYCESVPSVHLAASAGHYALWSVEGEFGPVFNGDANVVAEQNRIVVTFEHAPVKAVLKYHWDRGLRVAPPAVIRPVHRCGDPVPFIELDPGGARRVEIVYY